VVVVVWWCGGVVVWWFGGVVKKFAEICNAFRS